MSSVILLLLALAQPDPTLIDQQFKRIVAAAFRGSEHELRRLLQAGVAIDIATGERVTPLYYAISANNIAAAKLLLKNGASIKHRDDTFSTAIGVAAEGCGEPMLRLLLEHGSTVEEDQGGGFTPLMVAANAGNVDAVRFLISKGADASKKNKFGKTAFDIAQEGGHMELVRLLQNSTKK